MHCESCGIDRTNERLKTDGKLKADKDRREREGSRAAKGSEPAGVIRENVKNGGNHRRADSGQGQLKPSDTILKKDGNPFATKGSAKLVIASKKLKETHEPVEVDGGWSRLCDATPWRLIYLLGYNKTQKTAISDIPKS